MASICSLEKDRVLFDYIVNYVFPQYALPWNNFYTSIDAEPFDIRNRQRNQDARIARSPLVVDAKPELVIKDGREIPDWSKTLHPDEKTYRSEGSVIDSSATKSLLGKIISNDCAGFDYQYSYSFKLAGVDTHKVEGKNWFIFQLNLTQGSTNASVVVVAGDHNKPSAYSTISGNIIINQERTVNIRYPLPLGLAVAESDLQKIKEAIDCGKSNTVYGLYGNRIFIAIQVDEVDEHKNNLIDATFQFRIAESPSAAASIGYGAAIPGLTR
jgi:hypothetical protein